MAAFSGAPAPSRLPGPPSSSLRSLSKSKEAGRESTGASDFLRDPLSQLKEFGLKPRRTRTRRLPTITVIPSPEAPTTEAKPPVAAPASPAKE